jgi:hypothetical protein
MTVKRRPLDVQNPQIKIRDDHRRAYRERRQRARVKRVQRGECHQAPRHPITAHPTAADRLMFNHRPSSTITADRVNTHTPDVDAAACRISWPSPVHRADRASATRC